MNIISYAIGLNSSGGSKEPVLESISITANGTYTPDAGIDGYNSVSVSVPEPVLESISITANGTYTPEAGIDGYNSVSVSVPQEGAPTAEELTFTGDCKYAFASPAWEWFLNKYGNQITTTNLTSLKDTFNGSNLSTIPFSLNATTENNGCEFSETFFNCGNLTSVPTITGKVSQFFNVFNSCSKLTTIPDSLGELDFTIMNNRNDANCSQNFMDCYSLRYIPKNLLKQIFYAGKQSGSDYGTIYQYQFNNCYSLDALDGVAVQASVYNQDKLYHCCYNCNRLKTMKFDTNADGTPKTATWNNQSLDLADYVGYAQYAYKFDGNYGFTTATQVKDAATYEALKNNADYWTADINYSRYNHDSAVETINSLPDTSAYLEANGGTNTIKFMRNSGKLTDGGAIDTLTEEEIAVAVARGWTVAYY